MRAYPAALALVLALSIPSSAVANDPPSAPVYDQSVTEEFRIPTEYGSIYGWVTRPVVPAGVRVPVILTYSPYNAEEGPVAGDPVGLDGTLAYYVPRGYARAVVDLVGTNRSGGCTDYGGIRERKTAYDVVEFLGRRSWSNGKVGMIGGSYDGTTQWAAAIEQPPHLAAIVPQVAISRWWDYAYGQGVRFYSGSATPLAFDVGFDQARTVSPTDPDPAAEAQSLPDEVNPCDDVSHQQHGYLPNPVHDAFWDERDYRARADKVDVPVLFEGSWNDYNVHPINTADMWAALPPNLFKMMRMGTQGHGASNITAAESTRQAFFDRFLLGRESGVEALPKVVSRDNISDAKGVNMADWPPPGTQTETYTLAKSGETPETLAGPDTTWTDDDPQYSESDAFAGGSTTSDDASILFVSAPQPKQLKITGTAVLDVALQTSAVGTYVTPVLFEQTASGARNWITRGLLNSRNRDGIRTSTEFSPGSTWRAVVRFQPRHYRLAKGSRIGVALMSMNSTEAFYGDTTRATNTILLDKDPKLLLPIAP
jgi:predicted acyl esterase